MRKGIKMTSTVIVNGKRRYSKVTAKEVKQWEASASRLNSMMELAGINASYIVKKSEQSEKLKKPIPISNMSDYRHARRKIKDEHLDFIAELLYKALKRNGYKYDLDIFTLYLSGMETTCANYEEFENISRDIPDIKISKYKTLFDQAGFILSFDDGFYSIADDQGNSIDHGYDDPKYTLFFDGKYKHFNSDQIESFYQRIIKYMQDSFSKLKGSDVLD